MAAHEIEVSYRTSPATAGQALSPIAAFFDSPWSMVPSAGGRLVLVSSPLAMALMFLFAGVEEVVMHYRGCVELSRQQLTCQGGGSGKWK